MYQDVYLLDGRLCIRSSFMCQLRVNERWYPLAYNSVRAGVIHLFFFVPYTKKVTEFIGFP